MRWVGLVALLVGCSSAPAPAPVEPAPIVEPVSQADDYLVIERSLGTPGPEVPTVFGFHGRGDRADSFAGILRGWSGPARVRFVQAPHPYGAGWSWYDVSVRDGDSAGLARQILEQAEQIAGWLEKQGGPPPTVFGFSQGGMLSWALAVHHPEVVGKAISLGGWLPPEAWPERAGEAVAPLYVLHGEADPVVPVGPTQQAAQAMVERGFPVEVTVYPGVVHTVNRAMHERLVGLLE